MGCMFSGKTSQMVAEGERLERSGKKVIYFKHSSDTRYEEEEDQAEEIEHGRAALVRSHNGETRRGFAVKSLVWEELPRQIQLAVTTADVICIDELQFMQGAIEFCMRVTNTEKIILFAALDGDFNMNAFPLVAEILPKCEKFKKLHAVCIACGGRASFSRKIAGDPSQVVEVGGADKYVPTCRKHHAATYIISNEDIHRMRAMNDRILREKRIKKEEENG